MDPEAWKSFVDFAWTCIGMGITAMVILYLASW